MYLNVIDALEDMISQRKSSLRYEREEIENRQRRNDAEAIKIVNLESELAALKRVEFGEVDI